MIYNLAFPGVITIKGPKTQNHPGFLMHTCDNPPCCNPAHLKPCTHKENMADSSQKKRRPDFRGIKGPRAKLTEEDVSDIRLKQKYGATIKALAFLYGVSRSTIQGVLYGRHYVGVGIAEGF
ncbi:MAG TPA: hypothetical protein VMS08_06220 [Candidatus Saccharimonadia bacterium]|nr:hypothetical protein [Candidatus Saccharimonadia bacterium]